MLPPFNFHFPIKRWDEGIPLGNGLIGAIIWGDTREVVLSLDQATLWDERTPEAYEKKDWNFSRMLRLIRAKKWKQVIGEFESPARILGRRKFALTDSFSRYRRTMHGPGPNSTSLRVRPFFSRAEAASRLSAMLPSRCSRSVPQE